MTRKIRVGTTIPGIFTDSNTMMELESEVEDDKDIHQATDEAKVLLAELVTGGDPDQYLIVLAHLNYPNNKSFAYHREEVLKMYESDISLLNVQIAKAQLKAKKLLETLEKYQLIDRLRAVLIKYPKLEEAFNAIVKEVLPELNDDNTDNV